MKALLCFAMIALTCLPGVGRAALEFTAYLETPKEARFVISDNAAKTSSGWITLGQLFSGYTLVAFDRKNEVVSLKKGEATLELRLKDARVKEGMNPNGELAARLAAAKEELTKMLMRFTERHPRVREQRDVIAALEAQQKK